MNTKKMKVQVWVDGIMRGLVTREDAEYALTVKGVQCAEIQLYGRSGKFRYWKDHLCQDFAE